MDESYRPERKVMQFVLPSNDPTVQRVLNANNVKVIDKQAYADTKEAIIMLYLEWDEYDDSIYDADRSPILHHVNAFDVASEHNQISAILNSRNIKILNRKRFACPKAGCILMYIEWLDKGINDDIIDDENSNLGPSDL